MAKAPAAVAPKRRFCAPRRRAGRKKSQGWSGRSFVPDGTRFMFAPQPSDESLGYFQQSLRDVESAQSLRGAKARRKNPEGITSFSPGLRSYPGLTTHTPYQTPPGFCPVWAARGRNPVGVVVHWIRSPKVARPFRLRGGATLGWRPESL